jgi:hypothetical protein
VRKKGKLAAILTGIALPLCCLPLAIAGGVVGLSAMKLAKANKVATPGSALFAVIGAGLSLVITCVAVIGGYVSHLEDQKRLAGVSEKLAGKRTQTKLESDTACLLAEERVLDAGFDGVTNDPDSFDCSQATLKADARVAELRGVRFRILSKDYTATACYARGARWFVMKLTSRDECGVIHPPDEQSGAGKSDQELAELENKARERQTELEATALVDTYKAALVKIKNDSAEPSGDVGACADDEIKKRLGSRDELKVVTVDQALLEAAAPKADDRWSFLTSDAVRTLLSDAKASDKASAVKTLSEDSGDLIVVYRSRVRTWPKVEVDEGVVSDDFSYDGGVFAGWMVVYDLKSGARLCHGALAAENSDKVTFREGRFSSKREKAEKAVYEDFIDNFKEAASARIKQLNPKLKLGYSLLE